MPIDDDIFMWLKDYGFLSGWIAVGLLVVGWLCRGIIFPLFNRMTLRLAHFAKRMSNNWIRRYGIWRTQRPIRQFFESYVVNGIDIARYQEALSSNRATIQGMRLFSPMREQMKQPRLAPKLNDHVIANAIERMWNTGTLVKLPEYQIGISYSHAGYMPSGPRTYTITNNIDPSEARERERKAEEERACIETHCWGIVPECPRDRYAFQHQKAVLNEDVTGCRRCWESAEYYGRGDGPGCPGSLR